MVGGDLYADGSAAHTFLTYHRTWETRAGAEMRVSDPALNFLLVLMWWCPRRMGMRVSPGFRATLACVLVLLSLFLKHIGRA
jgi:hypothetical protein